MMRLAPSLAVAFAILIALWATPSVAEKIERPESLIYSSSFCGTGQKLARQAYRIGGNVSLALGVACATTFVLAGRRLGMGQRCLCEAAIILALTHGILAHFGFALANVY